MIAVVFAAFVFIVVVVLVLGTIYAAEAADGVYDDLGDESASGTVAEPHHP